MHRDETPFPHPQSLVEDLQSRAWVLSFAKSGGRGAEFGVFRGHFAKVIAETLRPKMLYLVDPWTKLGEKFEWGNDSLWTNRNSLTTLEAKEDCRLRMQFYLEAGAAELVEDTSLTFCTHLRAMGKTLDFVYVDSTHDFDGTLEELVAIDAILSEDGVILGDDWNPDPALLHHGVFRAVHQFIRTFDYEIVAAGQARQFCLRRSRFPSKELSARGSKPAGRLWRQTGWKLPFRA